MKALLSSDLDSSMSCAVSQWFTFTFYANLAFKK